MKYFLFVLVLVFGTQLWGQIQKGADIDGVGSYDLSGCSVSMPDVNTVAIGAYSNDGNGWDAGHVRIFQWNGSAWVQKGTDIQGEAVSDWSGWSVSMPDSNTVGIGAYRNDNDAGHVRIYRWDGGTWQQKGSDIDGESHNDLSGASVSMPDSNTVAIGAPRNDGNGSNSGHVRIYRWTGSAWVQKGTDIDGEASNDESAWDISMPDSNTVAIGAVWNSGNGNNPGHVRIYSWNGNAWVQKGTDIDGEAPGDCSGASVSMPDSNTVAIGAYGNDGKAKDAGHVRIYSWNGNAWVQKGSDIDGEGRLDRSGQAVSMPDINTVAIGAYRNSGNGANSGHVRIYRWDGGSWLKKVNDIDGEAYGDESGSAVSMPDSNTVAIGAMQNNGSAAEAGHVRIYNVPCVNTIAAMSPFTCDSYTSPSGNYIWTASGTYKDTIPNAGGCDSVMVIYLSLVTVDTSVSTVGDSLVANATGAIYQWLRCDSGYAVVSGATSKSFTPEINGNYAVEITQNGCTDTSACYGSSIGIAEENLLDLLRVYPNPSDGLFIIEQPEKKNMAYSITDITGKSILKGTLTEDKTIIDLSANESGVYLLNFTGQSIQLVRQ